MAAVIHETMAGTTTARAIEPYLTQLSNLLLLSADLLTDVWGIVESETFDGEPVAARELGVEYDSPFDVRMDNRAVAYFYEREPRELTSAGTYRANLSLLVHYDQRYYDPAITYRAQETIIDRLQTAFFIPNQPTLKVYRVVTARREVFENYPTYGEQSWQVPFDGVRFDMELFYHINSCN
jgi:hypothetical protein